MMLETVKPLTDSSG